MPDPILTVATPPGRALPDDGVAARLEPHRRA